MHDGAGLTVEQDGSSTGRASPGECFVVALGTAQDGGLPQLGSRSEPSMRARADASFRRLVASLLVVDAVGGGRWLVDATPDIREQTEMADRVSPRQSAPGSRVPLYDGVFLTHAHMGHYTGLVHFGREAYGALRLPVYGTEKMGAFLSSNGPWDQLVRLENVVLRDFEGGAPIELASGLNIRPIWVPHRGEYTDTVGFMVTGPNKRLLYIPDIDGWEGLDRSIEELISTVDYALLDATFYDGSELPTRDIEEIGHPFIVDSMARFQALPPAEREKIVFTHLNHTNPATDPESPEARRVVDAGMSIATDGQRFGL